MSEDVKSILKKFDGDWNKARQESRGQAKVLINYYIGEDDGWCSGEIGG